MVSSIKALLFVLLFTEAVQGSSPIRRTRSTRFYPYYPYQFDPETNSDWKEDPYQFVSERMESDWELLLRHEDDQDLLRDILNRPLYDQHRLREYMREVLRKILDLPQQDPDLLWEDLGKILNRARRIIFAPCEEDFRRGGWNCRPAGRMELPAARRTSGEEDFRRGGRSGRGGSHFRAPHGRRRGDLMKTMNVPGRIELPDRIEDLLWKILNLWSRQDQNLLRERFVIDPSRPRRGDLTRTRLSPGSVARRAARRRERKERTEERRQKRRDKENAIPDFATTGEKDLESPVGQRFFFRKPCEFVRVTSLSLRLRRGPHHPHSSISSRISHPHACPSTHTSFSSVVFFSCPVQVHGMW